MSTKFLLLISFFLLVGYVHSQDEEPIEESAEGSVEEPAEEPAEEAEGSEEYEELEDDNISEEDDLDDKEPASDDNSITPYFERLSYPGIIPILGAWGTVIEAVATLVVGKATFDDVKCSLEGVMLHVTRMISVLGAVGQIPIWGYALQPLIETLANAAKDIPFVGPALAFVLVGVSL